MTIGEALEQIIVSSVLHVTNMQLKDTGSIAIATELLRFVHAQRFEMLSCELPATSWQLVEEWARNVAFSVYIKRGLIAPDANNFAVVCVFKNIIPQIYTDLVIRGEVLEARLREDVVS